MAAADEFGLAVVGFTRKQGYNIYTHPEHISVTRYAEAPRGVLA